MELLKKEFIYEELTPSCHASTLIFARGGVLAAWFGGTHEKHDDVQIYCAFRGENGWEKPVCVSTIEEVPHWNPVLFDNGSEILLFYKRGKEIPTWETMICRSSDGGRTWSDPQPLCPGDVGGRGPVKNKPIRLSNGAILAGASSEMGNWRCFSDISFDNGVTWKNSPLVPLPEESIQVIQPSLWEDGDGVHMLMRSKNKRIWRADSPDGMTWNQAYPTDLPNNNSGLDLVQTAPGHLVLCCNPVNTGARTPLMLMESTDGGKTFVQNLVLENQVGEYSYPSVISDGKTVHGCYTWNRKKIVYFTASID